MNTLINISPLLREIEKYGKSFGVGFSKDRKGQECLIFPEEIQLLGTNTVEKRRNEFILGRLAAKKALVQLNHPVVPIMRGKGREPIWPRGIKGSITHSNNFAVSIVTNHPDYIGIGIDLEFINKPFNISSSRLICTESEKNYLLNHNEHQVLLYRIFSAKEAVFKAFYPLEFIFLNFKDAELYWDNEKQGFHGKLMKNASSTYGEGSTFFVHSRKYFNYIFSWVFLENINTEITS